MYLVKFPNGEQSNISLASGEKLGKGATADIYRFQHAGKNFAAKILRNVKKQDQEKIDAMISMASMATSDSNTIPFRHLTWPNAQIEKDGDLTGFAMPMLNHDDYIGLESFIDYNLRRKLPSIDFLSISLLVDLARRLAELLALLHSNEIYVVDLKPQNILVSNKDLSVHILDCDGFSIKRARTRYPAEHVSADYICPETNNKNLSPTELGEGQDRYSFAVLVFQLFNKGIHPFQGVVVDPSIDAPTNDQKAEQGLYAYGLTPNTFISPNPRSVHSNFPNSLRSLFDRSFTQTDMMRPSLKEWRDYFAELASAKQFKRCQKFPVDAAHIHFSEGSCIECYLFNLSIQTAWLPGTSKPVIQPKPLSQISKAPVHHSTVKIKSSVDSFITTLTMISLIVITFVLFVASTSKPAKLASPSTLTSKPAELASPSTFTSVQLKSNDSRWEGNDFVVSLTNEVDVRASDLSSIWITYNSLGCDGVNLATKAEMTLIQIALATKGYQISPDGIYGARTKAALIDFQKDFGISPTGHVTKETAQKLSVVVSAFLDDYKRLRGIPDSGYPVKPGSKARVRFFNLGSYIPKEECIRFVLTGNY